MSMVQVQGSSCGDLQNVRRTITQRIHVNFIFLYCALSWNFQIHVSMFGTLVISRNGFVKAVSNRFSCACFSLHISFVRVVLLFFSFGQ